MKLLLAIPYFYPKVGGLENYALTLAEELHGKFNWEISVVTSNHSSNLFLVENYKGMKIYRLPIQFKISNTPISIFWIYSLFKIIKTEKPDIINGHTPVPFIADLACYISKLLNIPFVLTYQNDMEKDNDRNILINLYYFLFGQKTFKFSQRIIVTTEYFSKSQTRLTDFKGKISIIPPGIESPNHVSDSAGSNNNNVLFIAQLDKTHRHKGLDVLINAFKKVVNVVPKAHLSVVGSGDDIERYIKLTKLNNLQKKITFLGKISDRKLKGVYKKSTLVVLPSTSNSEGFGMVLVEAASYKKPTIGSNIGGIPFVIEDNKSGFLVKVNDVDDLANKILLILQKPTRAKKMGSHGYKLFMKKYTKSNLALKTNKLFKEFTK